MEANGLIAVLGLAWAALAMAGYVCAAIAVVKMFQNDDRAWGIVSILTFPLPIVALVRTWLKRDDWQARGLALTWLGVVAAGVFLTVGAATFLRVYIGDLTLVTEEVR